MPNDKTNRALAITEILQLRRSERGRGALLALHAFVKHDATYSLDYENQAALANLLVRCLETPSVREILTDELADLIAPEEREARCDREITPAS